MASLSWQAASASKGPTASFENGAKYPARAVAAAMAPSLPTGLPRTTPERSSQWRSWARARLPTAGSEAQARGGARELPLGLGRPGGVEEEARVAAPPGPCDVAPARPPLPVVPPVRDPRAARPGRRVVAPPAPGLPGARVDGVPEQPQRRRHAHRELEVLAADGGRGPPPGAPCRRRRAPASLMGALAAPASATLPATPR